MVCETITYSSLGHKIGHANKLASGSVDKRLKPSVGRLVLNLNDMSEHGGLVCFHNLDKG
jgi:hypothetical protein